MTPAKLLERIIQLKKEVHELATQVTDYQQQESEIKIVIREHLSKVTQELKQLEDLNIRIPQDKE